MTPSNKDKKTMGVVVETYYHDKKHSIVVVRTCHEKNHCFFYVKRDPEIAFGDLCSMTLDEIFIVQDNIGQKFKKFKLDLAPWPGTLLGEIMSERANL